VRLLRPAEAATRRLILIAARGLVVKVPLPRSQKPKPKPEPKTIYVLDRVNGSIVSVPMVMPELYTSPAPVCPAKRSSSLSFPLFDPLKRFGKRRFHPKPAVMPRIRTFDFDPRVPFFLPPQPEPPKPPITSPDDPLDAARLHRRLDAIGRVLDDLPGQAMRMARWQARRDARLAAERDGSRATTGSSAENSAQPRRRHQRLWVMRPGTPPGWRKRPNHELYDVLNELHGLAVWARERRDSS
jgi:hypothetical protein